MAVGDEHIVLIIGLINHCLPLLAIHHSRIFYYTTYWLAEQGDLCKSLSIIEQGVTVAQDYEMVIEFSRIL